MTQHYFTKDGDWGVRDTLLENTKDWIIIPTDKFTDDVWEVVKQSPDANRYELVKHLQVGVHNINAVTMKCRMCGLRLTQVAEIDKAEGWNQTHTMSLSIDSD